MPAFGKNHPRVRHRATPRVNASRSHSKRQSKKEPVVDSAPNPATDSDSFPDPLPVPAVRPRPRPATTLTERRAAQNLLDALGGPESVIHRLRASGKSKAAILADMMLAKDFDRASFAYKINEAGLNILEFTQLLLDVNNAHAVARLAMSSERIAEQILDKALDQIVPHRSCLASGRVLEEREDGTTAPTNVECFECQGSGYVLKSGDPEFIDRYLELVQLKKNSPLVALTKNVTNQNLNLYGDLRTGDGAPEIDSIIKNADQQRLPPAPRPQPQLTDGSEKVPAMVGMGGMAAMVGMPEDQVGETIEAEVVSS